MSARTKADVRGAAVACPPADETTDPAVAALVHDVIGQVADKWTMLVLESLEEHGTLRFTQLGRVVTGISQKMLTQTLRQMEADGLLTRTVYPVVPPRVEYALAPLGESLAASFCGVWEWAEKNYAEVQQHRARYHRKLGL